MIKNSALLGELTIQVTSSFLAVVEIGRFLV
jgi:hypothetical protein